MKINLEDLKVGDKVFSSVDGEGAVDRLRCAPYIVATNKSAFLIDGRNLTGDKHPTLFHSFEEFQQYWAEYKEESRKLSGKEAFEAYKRGDRIRSNTWGNDRYISLTDEKIVHRDAALELLIRESDSDGKNWELV